MVILRRTGGAGQRSGAPLAGALAAVLTAVPVSAGALAGCSLISAHTTGANASFQAALGRISATPATRSLIHYDDTGALVQLAGTSWAAQGGFADLRGTGAGALTQVGQLLATGPGVNLLKAGYTITAGRPPQQVGLLAGGQPGQRISTGLARLGWTQAKGRLVAPSPQNVGGNQQFTSIYASNLAQVRTAGSDLRFGGAQADLSEIDGPSGPTLAGDPRIRALAGCLGDVVAAEIDASYPGGPPRLPGSATTPSPSGKRPATPSPSPSGKRPAVPSPSPSGQRSAALALSASRKRPASPSPNRSAHAAPSRSASPSPSASPSASASPSRSASAPGPGPAPGGPLAVAAGIRRPQSSNSIPQAVVCAAWPTQAAAAAYASELDQLLPSGTAPDLGVPYPSLLSRPSVRDRGGSQHLVSWQAGTPADAGLALQMVTDTTLPALPDCSHLLPQTAAHATGCS